jgi:hypothetical protein
MQKSLTNILFRRDDSFSYLSRYCNGGKLSTMLNASLGTKKQRSQSARRIRNCQDRRKDLQISPLGGSKAQQNKTLSKPNPRFASGAHPMSRHITQTHNLRDRMARSQLPLLPRYPFHHPLLIVLPACAEGVLSGAVCS